MASVVLVVFLVLLPVFVLVLCQKYPAVKKVGAVIICYVLGILLGNTGILPKGSEQILDWVTMVAVPLALPLLLFSQDVKKWFRLARPTLICLILMVASVALVCTGGFFLFQDQLDEAWKVSGMLTGVYTGGTPNLASIKTALSVPSETYLMVHTGDVMISAVFLLFSMTIARKIFGIILPPFTPADERKKRGWKKKPVDGPADMDSYAGIFTWPVMNGLLATFGLSVVIFATGEGFSLLVPAEFGVATAILTITTCGILCSMSKQIRNTKMTYQLGQYFILIFCVAVGAMADLGLSLIHI